MGGVFRAVKSIFSSPSAPSFPAMAGAIAGDKKVVDSIKAGEPMQPDAVDLAPEVEAPPTVEETLLKKKKKGRYSTLLTGSKGALGSPDIERKSLLGS
jgi:hypothetical protein